MKIKNGYMWTLIFLSLSAILVFLLSFNLYFIFEEIKKDMTNKTFNYLLKDVFDISKNIERYTDSVYGDLKNSLEKNAFLRKRYDLYLSSFVSGNFKNVFVVYKDKHSKFFKVLGDGSINPKDRFDFEEKFEPKYEKEWLKAFITKKPVYFNSSIKGTWVTFLYPVVKDSKVKYMIVIDFSTKPLRLIDKDLQYIKKFYFIFIIIIAVILFILMIFIFYDTKRERKVHRLLDELRELNENLKEKVKEEVKKSIEKDKQLIMQSRLALMGELLSMIAHQWRQPLNAIGSVVTNIEVDMEFNELNKKKLAKSIEKIKTTIQYLSETIDEFRRFYRKDMKKEDINIDESIKEVINLILPSLESKNIKINFNKRCNKKIKLMKNEFKQVILNIIKNAEDAIIQRNVKNPNIWIRTFVEEGKCVIEISDNAGGIDKKVRDKIFEPYFTTKNEKEGTGLGLYMSKNIVEKRLGGVLMQYNDEKGAVFRMEFEVCDVVERNN